MELPNVKEINKVIKHNWWLTFSLEWVVKDCIPEKATTILRLKNKETLLWPPNKSIFQEEKEVQTQTLK